MTTDPNEWLRPIDTSQPPAQLTVEQLEEYIESLREKRTLIAPADTEHRTRISEVWGGEIVYSRHVPPDQIYIVDTEALCDMVCLTADQMRQEISLRYGIG